MDVGAEAQEAAETASVTDTAARARIVAVRSEVMLFESLLKFRVVWTAALCLDVIRKQVGLIPRKPNELFTVRR